MALHNDVFKQQIWGFLCDDLESCLAVSQIVQFFPKNTIFKGGLNFTAALAIFSVIELATGYYTGKKTTTRAVADFLGKYFAPDFPAFKDKPFAMKFYEIFRHGLAHGWSPKAGGVAMDFRRDWALRFIKTQDGSEKIPSLNIPTFFEITKKALQGFESDLDKDSNLQAKFSRRYKALIDGDYKAMRDFREMFLRLKRPSETKSV
jgi:hypothetical protein